MADHPPKNHSHTIVDKPTIQYIMEEVVHSGIEEVVLITGREKGSIEDHFDTSAELEHHLRKKGRHDLLKVDSRSF